MFIQPDDAELADFIPEFTILQVPSFEADPAVDGTRSEVFVLADFASHAPTQLDAIDQSYIVVCGADGYVWRSVDAARTWETVDAGNATSALLSRIMIARDNPQVAYAIGASNAMIKTENGCDNWFPITGPSTGDGLLALWVKSQYDVLVGNDDGELWETEDGGISWDQQIALPGIGATASSFDIVGCGCGVLWLVNSIAGGSVQLLLRNVNDGASGFWYARNAWETIPDVPLCITCCDANRAIVGGGTTTTGMLGLVT